VNFEFREIDAADGCNSLSLGDASLKALKIFLRKEAKPLHAANLARTFVYAEKDTARVRAYVTIVCGQVSVSHLEPTERVDGFRYKDFPALKLARLAVDTSLQGQGIGNQLVDFVIGVALERVMPYSGCRFLVVDAKPTSISFYARKGFKRTGVVADDSGIVTMVIDLHRLSNTVNKVSTA
jgi:GNAT superfamily N-acetyltransferase